jgi:hypothetical protein
MRHWLGGKDKLDFLFKEAPKTPDSPETRPAMTFSVQSAKVQTAVRWLQEIEGMAIDCRAYALLIILTAIYRDRAKDAGGS